MAPMAVVKGLSARVPIAYALRSVRIATLCSNLLILVVTEGVHPRQYQHNRGADPLCERQSTGLLENRRIRSPTTVFNRFQRSLQVNGFSACDPPTTLFSAKSCFSL